MAVFVVELSTFAVEIKFVVKRLETDAEEFRGARFVVLRLHQSPHNHLAFNFFDRRADGERNRVFVASPLALIDRIRGEVVAFDLFA